MLTTSIDALLVLVLLLDLAMLAAGRLGTCIRIFAVQCLVLAFMPILLEVARGEHLALDPLLLAGGTIVLKVLLIPWVLNRTIRTGDIHREIEPLIGFTASVVLGAILAAGSFAISARMAVPEHMKVASDILVPVAISTVFIGLLVLVSRTKAITQVIGYLVVENGIYLFGLMLLKPMPRLVEMGILLDVFVGVFVMAIVVYHIRREFDHMDTHVLDKLKES